MLRMLLARSHGDSFIYKNGVSTEIFICQSLLFELVVISFTSKYFRK
jgi:hypothetical protein